MVWAVFHVVLVGVELFDVLVGGKVCDGGSLLVLWNHCWDYDKNLVAVFWFFV